MARQTKRLSARSVATLTKPGRHADGEGLYLVVDPSGAKRWLFLFRWGGKLKEMGLGGLASVSLAEARERAAEAQRVLASGKNLIEARRAAEAERDAVPTFGTFADKLVADLSPGFRNAKHRKQWSTTLTTYAAPLRDKPVNEISTDDILGVLAPIWQTKAETASRVRGRIERVLDAAKAKGTAQARTRPGGAVISTICFPSVRSSSAVIIRPCRMPTCRPSWSICAAARRSVLSRWNSRS